MMSNIIPSTYLWIHGHWEHARASDVQQTPAQQHNSRGKEMIQVPLLRPQKGFYQQLRTPTIFLKVS